MCFDFDTPINRYGSGCEKYDYVEKYLGEGDVLPMWVADMDFKTPSCILEALSKRLAHPILGYTEPPNSFYEAVIQWNLTHHQWHTDSSMYLFTPGVVTGLNLAIQAFSAQNDEVIVQSPVYSPFFSAVKHNGRRLSDNILIETDGYYTIDFDDLEKRAKTAKLLLLCNPQNPTGRVFTPEELLRIGEIAIQHDLIIISDEIHCDLVHVPYKHTPIAALNSAIAARTITLIAPSKTFNIAGLNTSLAVIADPMLKARFKAQCERIHTGVPTIFGMVALEAAYAHGEPWRKALMDYLEENIRSVDHYLKAHLPHIAFTPPEATFLTWLDCRQLGMNGKALQQFLLKDASVGFNDGRVFGKSGSGFTRMNIGTQRETILKALDQIKSALIKRGF